MRRARARASDASPACRASAPQQAPRRPGQRHAGSRRLDHALHVGVDVAHPGVHHAPGEQPHVGARRSEAGAPHGQAGGQSEAARQAGRDQPQPLRDGQGRRPRQQQPVPAESPQAEAQRPGRLPAWPGRRGRRRALGERGARRFDQAAEGHARRARRLAPPALDARLDRVDERVVGGEARPLHLAHGGHPAAGRQRLLARHPVRGAVGQAQPAGDAGGQVVVGDAEVHQPAPPRRERVAAGGQAAGGVEQVLDPPVELDHRGGHRARRLRCRGVDDAHAHLGHEPVRATPGGERPQVRGTQRPPVGRELGRAGGRVGEAGRQGLGADVVGMAVEQHPGGGAVPQDGRRAVRPRGQGERIGRAGQPALGGGQRPGPQHDLGDQSERAQRADEQAAQVEARTRS